MMHLKKALVALLIFSLLFAGAWVLHNENKRFFFPQMEQESDVKIANVEELGENVNDPGNHYLHFFEPFKPREYIRIRKRSTSDKKRITNREAVG